MSETKEFKAWHRTEVARRTGAQAAAEDAVKKTMIEKNLRTEVKTEKGTWAQVDISELSVDE